MKRFMLVNLLVLAGISTTAWACGVEGTAVYPSGSKHNNDSTIKTIWNSNSTIPRDGRYELDLGSSACGEKVTVYAVGKAQAEIRLPKSGNARLDLIYNEHGGR